MTARIDAPPEKIAAFCQKNRIRKPVFWLGFTSRLLLCPKERKTLIHNFIWLMVGIYLSNQVHLSKVANKISGRAKLSSKVQRLRHLLMNKGICVRKWYDPITEEPLRSQAQHGQIRLSVDGSKVRFHHQLLMVSIVYRQRSIPIVWTWVKHKRGHSSAPEQPALLRHVYKLMTQDISVLLVGDCEFSDVVGDQSAFVA